jgi:single-stranded DNA-specific DHH superfamily exonuclease
MPFHKRRCPVHSGGNMLKKWAGMITQADPIVSEILERDNAFLLHHDDADGCCAAAILLHLIATHVAPENTTSLAYASPENHSVEITPRLEKLLTETHPTYILSVDLALTKSASKLAEILDALQARMLIYDHHAHATPPRWPTASTYVNPLNHNLGNIPASCFAYILHKHYTTLEDSCWVAAIGTIADYRVNECNHLIQQVQDHYPDLYPYQRINQPTALRSPLMTMGHLINAGYQHADHRGARIAVEALIEALDLQDPTILLRGATKRTRTLQRFRRDVAQELQEHLEGFESTAEFHQDAGLAFYFMTPKSNITSELSTQLQHKHPDTILAIIAPETNKTLKVSLRRGINVKTNLAFLAEATSSTLDGASGGGHKDAAGCILPTDSLNDWKKAILTLLHKTITK